MLSEKKNTQLLFCLLKTRLLSNSKVAEGLSKMAFSFFVQ